MKNNLLILLSTICFQFGIQAQEAELSRFDTDGTNYFLTINLIESPSSQQINDITEFASDNAGNIQLTISDAQFDFSFTKSNTYYGIAKALHLLGIEILNVQTPDGMQAMNFEQFAAYYSLQQP